MSIVVSVALTLLITALTGVESWSAEHWLIIVTVPLIVVPLFEAMKQ